MFSTMKYNKGLDALTSVENLHNTQRIPSSVSSNRHLACKACRSGKFRCSGQSSGCDRCRDKQLDCVYTVKSKGRARARSSSSPLRTSETTDTSGGSKDQHQPSSNESWVELEDDRMSDPSDTSAIDPCLIVANDTFDADIMDWNSNQPSFALDNNLQDAIADMFSDSSISPPMDDLPQPGFSSGSIPSNVPEKLPCPQNRPQGASNGEGLGPAISQQNSRRTSRAVMGTTIADTHSQRHPIRVDTPSCHNVSFPSSAASPSPQDIFPSNMLDFSPNILPTQPPNTMILSSSSSTSRNLQSSNALVRTSSLPSNQCDCILTATKTLEAVSTDLDSAGLLAPDALLSFHKSKLSDCQNVLECVTCRSSSTVILLLALIAEKLIVTSRRLPSCINHWQSIQLGSYLMDSPDECQSIIKQIIVKQLTSLQSLLKTLLLLTYSEGCEMHHKTIRALYDRFKSSCMGMDVHET